MSISVCVSFSKRERKRKLETTGITDRKELNPKGGANMRCEVLEGCAYIWKTRETVLGTFLPGALQWMEAQELKKISLRSCNNHGTHRNFGKEFERLPCLATLTVNIELLE